ncbi:DNA ligase D [Achromobacter aloeverae]|uniref:DNA ligase (ATP) n=1 Tax=Achromobacter aloeverae TaxID=1750518 RepID=A0A4Q1HPP7_9BURK|nr:DNA ligase D [Achromobacter aloeverae]RXN91524.1 DNA ligase D [Achromobacter aloeverae]
MDDTLKTYRAKRDFKATTEPASGGQAHPDAPAFVIQKHWASRLHYDFRLELDGAMKSWAVPKGPSLDPTVKRMAVQVEDHPIAYNQFEGTIPEGHYGAGKVIIWDEGTWTPLGDARKGYREGHLKFDLHGVKLHGRWALVRMKGKSEKQPPWLLIKEKDEEARTEHAFSVIDQMPDSVVPLRNGADGTAKPRRAAAAAKGRGAKAAEQKKAVQAQGDIDPAYATVVSEANLPGVAAALPARLQPQLATLYAGKPPVGRDWIYELKFDGYRILARLDNGDVRLYTRKGNDWTDRLPHLARALAQLPIVDGWLDGEIVVLDDEGRPNFQALQNAFDSDRTKGIVYYLFDAPYLSGRDLRGVVLEERRGWLEKVLERGPGDPLRFSATFDAPPGDLAASACRMGFEGLIGKRREASYVSRRSPSWIKVKCGQRQEFIIVGYTPPQGSRRGLGALLLAVNEKDGALRYAGKVGTGFDDAMLDRVYKRLSSLAADRAPARLTGKPTERNVQWVRPEQVAEVAFGAWTDGGHVRHAVFKGLREDKPARDITRERAVGEEDVKRPAEKSRAAGDKAVASAEAADGTQGKAAKGSSTSPNSTTGRAAGKDGKDGKGNRANDRGAGQGPRLTHPDRVIDASTGITKLDLARFYGLVAPLLLKHLEHRPVSLVRAPQGIDHELFFQKHLEAPMPEVRDLPKALYPGHPSLLEVPTPTAIMSAVQMNTIEFHTWNAVYTAIDTPDRMLFDLDPGEGVRWPQVVEGAELVHAMLDELGLKAWLKTSGGKGLHVVVPLRKQYGWDTVKDFSAEVTRHLARTLPDRFVSKSGPKNRVGRIFVDYLRNGFGATTVAAWSARSRPGMGVSVPLAWDELHALKSGAQWTVSNIHERLDVADSPWDDYAPQDVRPAMRVLNFKPTDGQQ